MKFSSLLLSTTILALSFVSCKTSNENTVKKEESEKTVIDQDSANLLKYKVKEEIFNKDSLGINITGIYLEKIAEEEYKLKVKVDAGQNALKYHENYYVILSVYPLDKEIQLLQKERRKHGFEMFSAKIRKNKSGDLLIGRTIKTRINFARAITLTIIEYSSKKKSKEIVLQNVKF